MQSKELSDTVLNLTPEGVMSSEHIESIKEIRVSPEDFEELCEEQGFDPQQMDYVALPIACQQVLVVPTTTQALGFIEMVTGFQLMVLSNREDYNKARGLLEEDGPPEENGYASPK